MAAVGPLQHDAEASFRYAEASAATGTTRARAASAFGSASGGGSVGVVGLEAFAHLHQSVELGYWLRSDACRKDS